MGCFKCLLKSRKETIQMETITSIASSLGDSYLSSQGFDDSILVIACGASNFTHNGVQGTIVTLKTEGKQQDLSLDKK